MRRFFLLIFACFTSGAALAQWSFDLESGVGFPGYNVIRIPNQTGTTFDFSEDFQALNAVIPFRFRPGYTFGERNHVFALYAPLAINYESTLANPIAFQGENFATGALVSGFYKFNSYRLTYRRDFIQNERWILGLGLTAKIRDASVRFSTEDQAARKDDLGFVPLLHLYTSYNGNGWKAFLEGDGLAGGPGRAFDVFIGGSIPLFNHLDIKAGYRILEGGADINEVYNFTLINFAAVGLIWQLP
jgi:hypothetical protein